MSVAHIRRQKDWIDLDLSALIKDPKRWKLLFDGEERALWVLPWAGDRVDGDRDGWRFSVQVSAEIGYRLATRVQFVQAAAAGVQP